MNKSEDLIELFEDRPGHDFRYSLDSSRISRELKWKPKHSFESGLEDTIKWYIKNHEWWKRTPSKITKAYSWKTR